MATSARDWRKAREEGFEFTFPSGFVAAVRPLEVDFLVMHGQMIDPLAQILNALLDGKETPPDALVPLEEIADKKAKWLPLLNELASFMFVRPACRNGEPGDLLGEDEISVWDVSYADKVFLFRLVCRPADYLAQFRKFQTDRVAALALAKTNGSSTEPVASTPVVGTAGAGDAGPADSDQL